MIVSLWVPCKFQNGRVGMIILSIIILYAPTSLDVNTHPSMTELSYTYYPLAWHEMQCADLHWLRLCSSTGPRVVYTSWHHNLLHIT